METVVQRTPTYPHPVSPIIDTLHEYGIFVTLSEPILVHYYY